MSLMKNKMTVEVTAGDRVRTAQNAKQWKKMKREIKRYEESVNGKERMRERAQEQRHIAHIQGGEEASAQP